MIHFFGTGPQNRLSSDSPRLSPIMNQWSGGMVMGRRKLQPPPPPHSRVKDSLARLPLRITWPSTMASLSPGPATTRLMKLTSDLPEVGVPQGCGWPSPWLGFPHWTSCSEPLGGWKTRISPTSGSEKRLPMRLTSTRWPTSSVGSIDSEGIR